MQVPLPLEVAVWPVDLQPASTASSGRVRAKTISSGLLQLVFPAFTYPPGGSPVIPTGRTAIDSQVVSMHAAAPVCQLGRWRKDSPEPSSSSSSLSITFPLLSNCIL